MWSWDLAESHQCLTRCVWMILHLSRSLWKECVGLQCADGAAWRAVHVPSITTHCPARAGTVQGTNPPLLTRSAGTVMGASGWSNDLGENFLWKVPFSLCWGLQGRDWTFPLLHPTFFPLGLYCKHQKFGQKEYFW